MSKATKARSLKEFIEAVVADAGTDFAVGKYLNYSDGSRVGLWRKGQGRPDELACIKLARWVGDDPLRILHLAGYDEMADLLDGHVKVTPPSLENLRPTLVQLQELIDQALRLKEEK